MWVLGGELGAFGVNPVGGPFEDTVLMTLTQYSSISQFWVFAFQFWVSTSQFWVYFLSFYHLLDQLSLSLVFEDLWVRYGIHVGAWLWPSEIGAKYPCHSGVCVPHGHDTALVSPSRQFVSNSELCIWQSPELKQLIQN